MTALYFAIERISQRTTDGRFFCRTQKYSQVNDTFLKSDHPAVARTKPRLLGMPSGTPSGMPALPNGSPMGIRREAEGEEAQGSYNEYIIPIPDPKPEESYEEALTLTESTSRYGYKHAWLKIGILYWDPWVVHSSEERVPLILQLIWPAAECLGRWNRFRNLNMIKFCPEWLNLTARFNSPSETTTYIQNLYKTLYTQLILRGST